MYANNIKNSARLVGEVVSSHSTDKVTILTIKTEKKDEEKTKFSFPKAICFEKVKPQADKIEIGDHVLVDCTIQSNKRDENIKNQAMRTITVNHISKVDPSDERYHSVNAFKFFCKIININRVNEHVATARITFYTTRAHYLTVVYKNADIAKVDEFCNLPLYEYYVLFGSIETKKFPRKDGSVKFTEDCVISSYSRVKRKTSANTSDKKEDAVSETNNN